MAFGSYSRGCVALGPTHANRFLTTDRSLSDAGPGITNIFANYESVLSLGPPPRLVREDSATQ